MLCDTHFLLSKGMEYNETVQQKTVSCDLQAMGDVCGEVVENKVLSLTGYWPCNFNIMRLPVAEKCSVTHSLLATELDVINRRRTPYTHSLLAMELDVMNRRKNAGTTLTPCWPWNVMNGGRKNAGTLTPCGSWDVEIALQNICSDSLPVDPWRCD